MEGTVENLPSEAASHEEEHIGQESGLATDATEPVIEAEEDPDSGYDTNSLSDQTSVASSTYHFLHEHGHRYHRTGETLVPNDETEQDRLDLAHHVFKLLLDGELTTTVLSDSDLKILDVGCGTGIWAIETGDKYPSITIVGVDESPIQPLWVPPNVQFEIDDVTKPWLYSDDSFDFVHVRQMAGMIPDWTKLVQEAFRVLKPGGSIEISDVHMEFECQDGTLRDDSAALQWKKHFHNLAESQFKRDFLPSPKMQGWLKDAGYDVDEPIIKIVPIGLWPKDPKLKMIGSYWLSQMLEGGMENYSMALFTKSGWSPVEVHALLGNVRKELLNPGIHTFIRAWFNKGSKPRDV